MLGQSLQDGRNEEVVGSTLFKSMEPESIDQRRKQQQQKKKVATNKEEGPINGVRYALCNDIHGLSLQGV